MELKILFMIIQIYLNDYTTEIITEILFLFNLVKEFLFLNNNNLF